MSVGVTQNSELKMELASDPLFENRLDKDGVLLGNALMVGEYVYARIKADEPISIEGCSIHSLDNTMRYKSAKIYYDYKLKF